MIWEKYNNAFYNFSIDGQKNINIKVEKYNVIHIAWAKIVWTNFQNKEKQFELFEEYIDKLENLNGN